MDPRFLAISGSFFLLLELLEARAFEVEAEEFLFEDLLFELLFELPFELPFEFEFEFEGLFLLEDFEVEGSAFRCSNFFSSSRSQ